MITNQDELSLWRNKLAIYIELKLSNQVLSLDDNTFERVRFENCVLEYRGSQLMFLEDFLKDNDFDNVSFKFFDSSKSNLLREIIEKFNSTIDELNYCKYLY